MFEDYLQDAYIFYKLAEDKVALGQDREAKMFYRASVFCAASALEAFVNFIGDTFRQGDNLDRNEIAFLNDKIIDVSPSKASTEEKIKFNAIDSKIKFILKKFLIPIDLAISAQWRHFLEFKDLRDSLVHSKSISDERTTSDYRKSIKSGLNANIDIMNAISEKIFSKPLRKGLTELKI